MLLKKLVVACVDHDGRKKRAFLKNGGLVLEKLVASCNGRPIPIRTFSYQELILATNSFDPRLILREDGVFKIYKGSFEGRILSIKSYKNARDRDFSSDFSVGSRTSAMIRTSDLALEYSTPDVGYATTDLAISAKMSAHKNIHKLVGCCLETSVPTLVYEYAQNGVLADRIYISRRQGTPIVWQSRLKIARQIAHAIAYLHTGFSRPIIHRNIKPGNIFLDQHDVPKLTDFSFSISIPEGETHVEDSLCGTVGFMCPIYMNTSRITEKTDVFSFGKVLLHLLTGQDPTELSEKACENNENLKDYLRNSTGVDEICDPAILAEEGGVGVEEQLQAVLQLVLTCIEDDQEIRPTMVDVTKELRRIERYIA